MQTSKQTYWQDHRTLTSAATCHVHHMPAQVRYVAHAVQLARQDANQICSVCVSASGQTWLAQVFWDTSLVI